MSVPATKAAITEDFSVYITRNLPLPSKSRQFCKIVGWVTMPEPMVRFNIMTNVSAQHYQYRR